MNGNYFSLYVYTVVYGRGLCLQVMQKLVDSEGLAKMFNESGVVEMVEVYPVTFSLLQIWVLECICLCVCLSSVCQISHFNWKS